MSRKFVRSMEIIFLIVLLFLLLFSFDGSAKTITVDDDGGADYTKIQDAINASENGNTIRVFDGTYIENVIVNKSINLIGNGSEITSIDAKGNGDVVKITADWVNISGFNVTGSQQYYAGIEIASKFLAIMRNIVKITISTLLGVKD